jgi:protein-disulfide isomerase/catechol 2,3-dioxygenase-like lactoylglutathione lyase family enzyme/uncharacterized membrane protein
MQQSLTLGGNTWQRTLIFISGLGMAFFSILTINHFYAANFPSSIWAGSFCDISAFFNCDSSAFSSISQIGGVPLGYFGLMVGALVVLGTVFPSESFERTNKFISLFNAVGVVALLLYSVIGLGSLCLLCSGFYIFSFVSVALFWKYGIDSELAGFLGKWLRPSIKYLAASAVVTLLGAYGFTQFHEAKLEAQSGGVAARVVRQYFSLPEVSLPSIISPYWTAKATENFEDAPIRIVEYADVLCPDCLFLHEQMLRLKEEFKGKMNVAFQFFPLEAQCNDVVAKDKHPGACDLTYMIAHDPEHFVELHDEIFANMQEAKRDPEWRAEFGRRHGLEAALEDEETIALVDRIMNTGREYEKTSDEYAHGIRSTPTMIVNGRMIIGTLPFEQLRAIFQALVDEAGGQTFIENWEETDPEPGQEAKAMIDGVGGAFLFSNDPQRLANWYVENLGMEFEAMGTTTFYHIFWAVDPEDHSRKLDTTFSIMEATTPLKKRGEGPEPESMYGDQPFMVNLRVRDIDAVLDHLASKGIEPLKREDWDYGRFAWVRDADGNRIELYQPLHG